LVCFVSWLCPTELRLIFAFPLTALTLFLSIAFLTDSRERRELRILLKSRLR
jgi:hypothetical protein